MKEDKIKVGIVGVGRLGVHHLKHLKNVKDACFVGAYDIRPERLKEIAKAHSIRAFDSLSVLIENCDALSIVVPTRDHFSVAKKCISRGKHVFIEKPICNNLEEADELINMADQKSVIIQVGHIERLNPALLALDKLPLKPKYIETHRLSPYTIRGTDVPVVLDLMIHDLDVILALVKSKVKTVHASGVSIMTNSVDIANARIRFENGVVANLTSSRIAKDSVRKLRLFQRDMYVTIDFLQGLTDVYRVLNNQEDDPEAILSEFMEYRGVRRQLVYEKPPVKKINALKAEMQNFVESIRGKTKPIVSGKEGRDVLEVALIIQEKIEQDIH